MCSGRFYIVHLHIHSVVIVCQGRVGLYSAMLLNGVVFLEGIAFVNGIETVVGVCKIVIVVF